MKIRTLTMMALLCFGTATANAGGIEITKAQSWYFGTVDDDAMEITLNDFLPGENNWCWTNVYSRQTEDGPRSYLTTYSGEVFYTEDERRCHYSVPFSVAEKEGGGYHPYIEVNWERSIKNPDKERFEVSIFQVMESDTPERQMVYNRVEGDNIGTAVVNSFLNMAFLNTSNVHYSGNCVAKVVGFPNTQEYVSTIVGTVEGNTCYITVSPEDVQEAESDTVKINVQNDPFSSWYGAMYIDLVKAREE